MNDVAFPSGDSLSPGALHATGVYQLRRLESLPELRAAVPFG